MSGMEKSAPIMFNTFTSRRIKKETIVLSLYGTYSFISILNSSLLQLQSLYRAISVAVFFLGTIIVVWENRSLKLPVWRLLITLCLLVFFGTAALVTDRSYLATYATLIILADRCNFNRIVRVSLTVALLSLTVILILCALGILRDHIYYSSGFRTAHCLGFSYYSKFPFILFCCFVMLLYLTKKKNLFLYLILLIVNMITYKYTTLRLTYYLTYLLVGMDWFLKSADRIDLSSGKWSKISAYLFPVGLLMTAMIMIFYNSGNKLMSTINTLLNNRIGLMHEGYMTYSVKLFGNYIAMRGNSALRDTIDYFYIDSGFAYSLLAYGLLFSIIVVFLYSAVIYYACKANNKGMFIWAISILFFTMINNIWISVTCNPLLMVSVPVLRGIRNKAYLSNNST